MIAALFAVMAAAQRCPADLTVVRVEETAGP